MESKDRNLIVLGVFLVILLAISSYFSLVGFSVHEKETIKIGAVLPLTGTSADAGEYIRKGLDLAIKEVNEDSRNKYQLIFEDSEYSPQIALSAANKLIFSDKVKVILPYGSSISLALAPIAEQNKVILLDPASQSDKISQAGDYIFRVQSNVLQEAEYFSEFIKKKTGNEQLGIIALNTEYGESVIADYSLDRLGLTISSVHKFDSKETDFKTILLKLKSSGIKSILLATNGKQAGTILKQANSLNYSFTFFATSVIERNDLLESAGVLAEGLIYPYPYDAQSTNRAQSRFRETYFETYGDVNEMLSANAYDSIKIVASCIDSEKELKSCLYKVKDYQGASGIISFDDNGDVTKQFITKTIKNGKFVAY